MFDESSLKVIAQGVEGPPNYDQPPPPRSPGSPSSFVKRTVERATDKLHRNKSPSKTQLSQSQPALSLQGHRSVFHRSSWKGKERAIQGGKDEVPSIQSQFLTPPTSSVRPSHRRKVSQTSTHADDDSPFITPRSPPLGPSRSILNIFRGDGSMRAGTQTLIQALQAMPWVEDQDNDDELNHDVSTGEPESDDDDDRVVNRLASSIHAIYRPLARSRRDNTGAKSSNTRRLASVSDVEDEPTQEEPVMSEEDVEEDFEPSASTAQGSKRDSRKSLHLSLPAPPDLSLSQSQETRAHPSHPPRSGSMATVKLKRRTKLAEKLKEIFELEDIQEVVAEMPCWLLRSILLQGYMYLTNSYLCFFAHMPSREDQVLKSGWLNKRATRTKRWIRHWFILKNDVLSWYQSSSDPYFPHGVVDLRYVMSCEPSGEKDIRLRTNQKSIKLSADSIPSRDEWIKALRKVMFKAQNMGDSVKIAIPYAAIVDVEKSTAMDFSETIEVKTIDNSDRYSVDSYFFAYFQDLSAALDQIRDAIRTYRSVPESPTPPPVMDTTAARSPRSPLLAERTLAPAPETPARTSSVFRFTSLLRPLQESLPLIRGLPTETTNTGEEYTHISKRGGSSFVPVTTTSPKEMSYSSDLPEVPSTVPTSATGLSPAPVDHTYPPANSLSASIESPTTHSRDSSWGVHVSSWLRMPSRRLLSSLSSSSSRPSIEHSASAPAGTAGGVSEVLTTHPSLLGPSRSSGEYGFFSILEAPESTVDVEMEEKFRTSFAFDEKEKLLGCFPGYIFRLLPVYGRLFISTNYFSFRSSGPLTSRTTMILPIKDILSTEPCKAFRFGHHGLVVIVRGHEELFFEFSDESKRASLAQLLEKQVEEHRKRASSGESHQQSLGQREALILEEFGPRTPPITDMETTAEPDAMEKSVPAVMFTSQSSTFLTFKPKNPLHFTFLTIGSRGDVQPYIALAKGLMADGHKCRIATHGEFQEWIESYGIEFGYVGGDPAELMRICVENGTFTVSFLREGVTKFRGWIDDLLKTSWDACQGTDVLVESPSAMGGIHIAEALGIPYFRAFTMTWSRTRAYPHAFAVPEHKMGGNYNYMSYVLFDQVFWRGTAGQINRWRRNTLGLQGTSLDKLEPHKVPFLYNFSPTVVPPPFDWPEWIRITGYWFLDDANVSKSKWKPSPELLHFIETARKNKKKIVYIGFGSIVVSDPKSMTRAVVDAIVQSGVYAILSKGWSDRLVKNAADATNEPETYPEQIFPISSIPHDWLFKQIDAACHHGGAGTTGASLRAGIPTIIKPFFGDQFFWADRVEALGIGSAVRKLHVQSLTDALMAATTDTKQIARAKAIGEQIRAENGVGTAIEAIYRDLEYARSLIKRPAQSERLDADGAASTFSQISRSTRVPGTPASKHTHTRASSGSTPQDTGAASDWSVISDQED